MATLEAKLKVIHGEIERSEEMKKSSAFEPLKDADKKRMQVL